MRTVAFVTGLALGTGVATGLAQRRGGFGGPRQAAPILPNIPYDGRFTFVRLRYGPPVSYASQRVMWSHDYPTGERNFMRIMDELTLLAPHTDETNILALDDPELFNYPVAYLCEPGYQWTEDDRETAGLRAYLLKGGFLIVDDFRARDWPVFEGQMRRALPDVQFFDLDAGNPIFHSFFEIDAPDGIPQLLRPGQADLPRDLRKQRSLEAAHRDHQLQHRHLGILGVFRYGLTPHRRVERRLQARRQLPHLRDDPLTGEATLPLRGCQNRLELLAIARQLLRQLLVNRQRLIGRREIGERHDVRQVRQLLDHLARQCAACPARGRSPSC